MPAKKNREKASESPVVEQVQASAHEAIDEMARRAAPAEQQVRDAAAQAQGRAKHTADQATTYTQDIATDISEKIRQYPLVSIGIAAGAGYLLSSLLRK